MALRTPRDWTGPQEIGHCTRRYLSLCIRGCQSHIQSCRASVVDATNGVAFSAMILTEFYRAALDMDYTGVQTSIRFIDVVPTIGGELGLTQAGRPAPALGRMA